MTYEKSARRLGDAGRMARVRSQTFLSRLVITYLPIR